MRAEKEALRKEIATLSGLMGSRVETPMQNITSVINGLLNRPELSEEVRSELTRLASLYPADPGVTDLMQLYTRALEAEPIVVTGDESEFHD